mgnify:CR=1 FL=1
MIEHLLTAMDICDNGDLPFNQGNIRAFLHGKKWYPLRAIFVYVYQLAGLDEPTSNEALVKLAYLIPYTRIDDINFHNNFPVELNEERIINEIRYIKDTLNGLLQ